MSLQDIIKFIYFSLSLSSNEVQGHELIDNVQIAENDFDNYVDKSGKFIVKHGNLYEIINNTKSKSKEVSILDASCESEETNIWSFISSLDTYKTAPLYSTVNGVSTLTRMKYIVLPIWWSNENPSDSSLAINSDQIQSVFDQNYQYYLDMSWNKARVTVMILSQSVFPISKSSPDFGETKDAAREIVSNLGYEQNEDYNGIILVYNGADSGPFANGGGWASVNGDFMWMTYELNLAVTRHEAGHNFGHPHHVSDSYKYRLNRPKKKEGVVPYDGWDMMSGGNGYDISHFAAAAKWFWNWIPESSVINMDPKGASSSCSSCTSSGTFILTTFDNKDVAPSSSRKMAIHIPVAFRSEKLYSYWLSYRTGNGGAASKGLSVHVAWFSFGGMFGASYDSMNFDAYGDTETTQDSFVTPGSCYHLAPLPFLKDNGYWEAESVQPVVCVDNIEVGKSITVTVSFLNDENSPSPQVTTDETELICSKIGSSTSVSSDGKKHSVIHVQKTGYEADIEFDFCTASAKTTAYFYDTYPHSVLSYNSEPAYGSYLSLSVSNFECCSPGSTVPVNGAKVIVVKQNIKDFLHLVEIEIYDSSGNNLALGATCHSRDIGWGGDPNCLNDGITALESCYSHSRSSSIENYDYCVLKEAATDIATIKVYPFVDLSRTWMTNRLRDLQLSIYAEVTGEGDNAMFQGELASYRLDGVFSTSLRDPHEQSITTLATSVSCQNTVQPLPKSIRYTSLYDNTYIVILPSIETVDTPISASVTCNFNECMQNSFLNGNTCAKCPENSKSEKGSTSVSDCIKCPDATNLEYELSSTCILSSSYRQVSSSKGWRILTTVDYTEQWWGAWVLKEVEHYESTDCTGVPIDNSLGTPFDSRNAGSGWGPEHAYGGQWSWGGRLDDDDFVYVGMMYLHETQVGCIKFYNADSAGSSTCKVLVQAYDEEKDKWDTTAIFKNVDMSPSGTNIISLAYEEESAMPSAGPSLLTISPTEAPVTNVPTGIPSLSPNKAPSDTPIASSSPTRITPVTPISYDDWTLNYTSYSFQNAEEGQCDRITIEYKIGKNKSNNQFLSNIMEEDCITPISDESITVSQKSIINDDLGEDKGFVVLELNDDLLQHSPLRKEITASTSTITFCVKSELLLDDLDQTSISFVETVVKLNYDFMGEFSSFQVDNISINKYETENIEKDRTFELSACICLGQINTCIEYPVLSQNSEFQVCVMPSNGMNVVEFQSFRMIQDGIIRFTPIENGAANGVTTTTIGAIGVVQTRAISSLFAMENPSALIVEGEVMLGISTRRERNLIEGESANEDNKGKFELSVNLQGNKSSFGPLGAIFLLAQVMLLCIFGFMKEYGRKSSEYMLLHTSNSSED